MAPRSTWMCTVIGSHADALSRASASPGRLLEQTGTVAHSKDVGATALDRRTAYPVIMQISRTPCDTSTRAPRPSL